MTLSPSRTDLFPISLVSMEGTPQVFTGKKNMSDKKIGCPTYFLWHNFSVLTYSSKHHFSLFCPTCLVRIIEMSLLEEKDLKIFVSFWTKSFSLLSFFLNYNWTLDIQTKAVCLKFLFHLCTSDMKCSIKLNRVLSVCALSHKNHQRTIKSLEREERTPAILIRRVARWAQGEQYFDLGRLSQLNY